MGPELPPDLIRKRKRPCDEGTARRCGSDVAVGPDTVAVSRTSEEGSDDDVGPMLPDDHAKFHRYTDSSNDKVRASDEDEQIHATQVPARQDWMLAPPEAGDWMKNIDTTKLKSRTFTTARPGRPPPTTDAAQFGWTEVAGARGKMPPHCRADTAGATRHAIRDNEQRKIVEQHKHLSGRQDSLVSAHGNGKSQLNKDIDDPSSRPFDREKDIAINADPKKTKRIIASSKNLDSMFDSGKFL